MRTKTLLLTAMLGVAGIVSSYAQNVYSVNVVGYHTVTIVNDYDMFANQMDDGAGNLAVNLIPTAPIGTIIYKYNPVSGGYATLTRIPTGWLPATSTMTLAPGEGAWVKKPVSSPTLTFTFTGEVLEGDLTNPIGVGYDIYSAMVPQEGGIVSIHGYTASTGDIVYEFLPASGGYRNYTYLPTGSWIPSEPVLKVGQAFWIKSNAAKNWDRSFTVPREP
jgi:hypothetical protein